MESAERQRTLFQAALLLFAVLAIVSRAWVAEDAYITFRVVENLFAGHGLVLNPGDRVEAFTHPLWMFFLVLIKGSGLSLHFGALLVGGTLSFAGIALLIYDRRGPWLWLAAPALVALSGFRDFATSGMEFSLVFFLFVVLDRLLDGARLSDRPAAIATVLSLLYLTRPELALGALVYSGFLLSELFGQWRAGAPLRDLTRIALRWALPFLLIAGGWHLFRALYYHDIFPNTYYAKSGADSFYSQGLKYLAHTLLFSPALWVVLALLGAFVALRTWRATVGTQRWNSAIRDLVLPIVLIAYWVRAGGDFMSFRMLLPPVVLLALATQRFFVGARPEGGPRALLLLKRPLALWASMAVFVGLSFVPAPFARGYIADERQVFTRELKGGWATAVLRPEAQPWSKRGRAFRELQECLQLPELRITNSQAAARCLQGVGLGYFGVAAGPRVLILDEQGLPNREVAMQPIVERFRPGHEHFVTLADAIAYGATFCSSGEPEYDRAMVTSAGIVVRFEPELVLGLPDAAERLETLVRLKRDGSRVIPRFENRYGITVEALAALARERRDDPLLRSRQECWRSFQGGPATFFY